MSEQIREICNKVYRLLGPGHAECVYHRATEVSLREMNIPYQTEVNVPIVFEKHTIGNFRVDLIVDNKTIVELKAIRALNGDCKLQAKNYMRFTGIQHSLLVNFPQKENCHECDFEEYLDLIDTL